MSRLIAFYSPARCGATTLLANCAADLAARGARVAALDLNLTAPSLGIHLDLLPADRPLDRCLSRVLPLLEAGRLSPEALEKHLVSPANPKALRVLPGLLDVAMSARVSEEGVRAVTGAARQNHDFVLCDLSPALDSVSTYPVLEAADLIVLVTAPAYPARFHTKRYLLALSDLGWQNRIRLVINQSGEVAPAQVQDELGLPAALTVPTLSDMAQFEEQGRVAATVGGISRQSRRFLTAIGRLSALVRGG